MEHSVRILALIPARGGSKGIPRKNIVPLFGKPLIAHTIDVAKRCPLVDRVIVSTDDDEITQIARNFGAEVPCQRPPEYSDDTAPALAVIEHMLTWLEENEQYTPDAVLYLQPTSPFRKPEHLTEAIELFAADGEADGLVSVTPVPHNFHPHKVMIIDEAGCAMPHLQGNMILDRHSLPPLYARNGPNILITATNVIREKKALYGTKTLPYIMTDRVCNIDIDEPDDLMLAELHAPIFFRKET